MDEILATIRRIIAEDERSSGTGTRGVPAGVAPVAVSSPAASSLGALKGRATDEPRQAAQAPAEPAGPSDVLDLTDALDEDSGSPPGKLLILSGKTLVSTVGGASGPLWGSALRSGGRVLGDRPTFEGSELVEVLAAALASIKDLGTAAVGDKTMVDALEPAVEELRSRLASGAAVDQAVEAAAAAAEHGASATVPLQARKGRASYLGERSVGHQDPGATSTALIIRALQKAVQQGS